MPKSSRIAGRENRASAFTLVELLVAMTVLVLLIAMVAQMTNGVSNVIGHGQGHIDMDAQARALLDRMAIDFGAMVKRPDVDYYLKGRPEVLTQGLGQITVAGGVAGAADNDQIAFYSEVPGYFSAVNDPKMQSSASLIAYRVNSNTLYLERLSKGLAWNGVVAGTDHTMAFLPVPLASPLPAPLPSPMPAAVPEPICPAAADASTPDPDYEQLASNVFRFEYYYVLKGQSASNGYSMQSVIPWYKQPPVSHTSVNGMQDIAGIGVVIALIDTKSRLLVSKDQLATLVKQMGDAPDHSNAPAPTATNTPSPFTSPNDIESQWRAAVQASALPRPVASAIRIYSRCFYLNGTSL